MHKYISPLLLALLFAVTSGCGKLTQQLQDADFDLAAFTTSLEQEGEIVGGDPAMETTRGVLPNGNLRMDVSWGAISHRYQGCVEWDLRFSRKDGRPLNFIRVSRLEDDRDVRDSVEQEGDDIVAHTRTYRGTDGFRVYLPRNAKVQVTGKVGACEGNALMTPVNIELSAVYQKKFVYKEKSSPNHYLGAYSF